MAYVSTDSASLGGTAGGAGLVQKAYDRLLEFALRSEPLIRSVADKRPARQAIPGSTVVLQRYVDLSPATTVEITDNTNRIVKGTFSIKYCDEFSICKSVEISP